MTDKHIIIDGVDVSGCEFLIISNDKHLCRCIKSDLFGGIEFVENAKNGNCKNNPNCIYKQLKRKEQKLAKINEILEIHKDNKCAICPEFDECFEHPSCDNIILQIIEDKENE